MEYLRNGVNGTIIKPNEARRKLDMEDAEGGDVLLANGSIVPLTMACAEQYLFVEFVIISVVCIFIRQHFEIDFLLILLDDEQFRVDVE